MNGFKHAVRQIRFSDAANKRAPKEYWQHISNIADLIAHRLSGIDANSSFHITGVVTTIAVMQYKEKFGDVRVYCRLADPARVATQWANQKNTGMPSGEFIRACRLRDAKHYRETYMMIFSLCPQYYNAVRSAADYPALLCESREELEDLLSSEYYTGWEKDDYEVLFKICDFDKEKH